MTLRQFAGLGALLSLALHGLALAADPVAEPVLNSGDTAWMLTSTALVLFMTIPGLALFYGGMVRSKNILSVMMQCFAITGLISILWVVYGYSIAFDKPVWKRASSTSIPSLAVWVKRSGRHHAGKHYRSCCVVP